MMRWLLILAIVVAPGCDTLGAVWNEPLVEDGPGVQIPVGPEGEGGVVEFTPPEGSGEPVTTELPGGGEITVQPAGGDTVGGAISQGVGGLVGTFSGNPLLGVIAAGAVSMLGGALIGKKKKPAPPTA